MTPCRSHPSKRGQYSAAVDTHLDLSSATIQRYELCARCSLLFRSLKSAGQRCLHVPPIAPCRTHWASSTLQRFGQFRTRQHRVRAANQATATQGWTSGRSCPGPGLFVPNSTYWVFVAVDRVGSASKSLVSVLTTFASNGTQRSYCGRSADGVAGHRMQAASPLAGLDWLAENLGHDNRDPAQSASS